MGRKIWEKVSDFGARLETYGGMVGVAGKPNPLMQKLVQFGAYQLGFSFGSGQGVSAL
jgi:hypothetical protein